MAQNFGWAYNSDRIAIANARMEKAGCQVSFSADRPSLRDFWKRRQAEEVHVVAAQNDEMTLNGKWRLPNSQVRGTCVGQGSSRAIEDVHISRIVDKEIVGVYTQIAYEPMYGYERHLHWSRTQAWGTPGECNDGLQGADAAAFYSTIGVVRRASYDLKNGQTIDLTNPQEHYAIEWNNSGVPAELIADAAPLHKIQCHSSSDWNEYADAIAAKCWGHICLPQCFGLSQVIVGQYGTVEPDANGGHDTECCGVVTLPNGETGFLIQQSWGANGPKYPPEIQVMGPYGSSTPMKMRPGSYCVRQSILEGMGPGVERISCDIPSGSSFR